jgi:hypothetical protein
MEPAETETSGTTPAKNAVSSIAASMILTTLNKLLRFL